MAVSDPQTEFNQTALDSCRSTIVQQEAELKVLRESNVVKNKKIMQLESQIGVATSYISSRDQATPLRDTNLLNDTPATKDIISRLLESMHTLHGKVDTLAAVSQVSAPPVNIYNNTGPGCIQTRSNTASQTLAMTDPVSDLNQPVQLIEYTPAAEPTESSSDTSPTLPSAQTAIEETENILACTLCDEVLDSIALLESHLDSAHSNPPNVAISVNNVNDSHDEQCDYCGLNFQDRKQLQEHISEKHATSYLQCSNCIFRFQTRHLLADHVKACHDPETRSAQPPTTTATSLSSSQSTAAMLSESL